MSNKVSNKAYSFLFALAIVIFAGFYANANAQVRATMTFPTAGTRLTPGQQVSISWTVFVGGKTSTNYNEQEVFISYDNGTTWELISQELPKSARSFDWVVPNIQASNVLIDIRCGNGVRGPEYLNPQRQATFSIGNKIIKTSSITMGKASKRKATAGDKVEITWDADFETDSFEVFVSYDDGLHFQSVGKTAEKSFVWSVPEIGSARVTFRVVGTNADGQKVASRIPVKPNVIVQ